MGVYNIMYDLADLGLTIQRLLEVISLLRNAEISFWHNLLCSEPYILFNMIPWDKIAQKIINVLIHTYTHTHLQSKIWQFNIEIVLRSRLIHSVYCIIIHTRRVSTCLPKQIVEQVYYYNFFFTHTRHTHYFI